MYWPRIHQFVSFGRGLSGPRGFGLYVAAVCCAALTSAGVFFAMGQFGEAPDARHGALPKTIVAAPSHSRMPRPRPDEPATTGSIRPASRVADIFDPPMPVDADSASRAEELREKAVLIAASWEDCDQIESAEPLAGESGFLTIRIVCANGTSAYMDEAEIETIRPRVEPLSLDAALGRQRPEPEPPDRAKRLSDMEAIAACEENVRLGLPKPHSLSRIAASTGVDRAPGENAVVRFDFGATNGLGFPLALRVLCVFDAKKLARLQVSAR
jgi:hypothetical protein